MKNRIDLHVHSTASDGTLTPTQLVELATKYKLKAFALTDHDTTAGIDEALKAAAELNPQLEVIPGVELSTHAEGRDIHIVGLDIDKDSPAFQKHLKDFRNSREVRNKKMIQKLQEVHIDISDEVLLDMFGDTVITRAHIAKYLHQKGYVRNIWEAFPRYIGDGAPCFVPRGKIAPRDAIRMIQEANGVAVLAHPLRYEFTSSELEDFVSKLAGEELDAIEAIYSMNGPGDEQDMKLLAKRYDLKLSGGSDFHGMTKPNIRLGFGRGNIDIPYAIWRELRMS